VFGTCKGAFAEYGCAAEGALVLKPANVTFEQAAAVPVAAITALQGLRDKGRIQRGQKVLINGAAGGVGTFAVQIARVFGADVTGVCSTRNVDMVRSIGAHHVLDYTRENFTKSGQRYDLIVDTVGNHSLPDTRRALTPQGTLVLVGGPDTGGWLGPLTDVLKVVVLSRFVSHKLRPFLARLSKQDLIVLQQLLEAGKVTPVIDRRYPLRDVAGAIRYLEEGHARGKVVISMEHPVNPRETGS
jgi:NADPH:quinone reductase-like Zn-dependent oxidoreductase